MRGGAHQWGQRKMAKWVYSFGDGEAEGSADMRNLLGGKGANLAEMTNLGLPVPPGFTITTEVCTHYYANGQSYPPDLAAEVEAALAELEAIDRQVARRRRAPAPGLGALGRARLDARDDGHRPQPRPQRPRRSRRSPGSRRPALRLRLLPPLHPDVFGRGARHRSPPLRGAASRTSRTSAASTLDTDLTGDDWRSWSATTRPSSSASAASRFPRTPKRSSGARSARSSSPG